MFRSLLLFSVVTVAFGGTTNVERCLRDNGDLPLHTYFEGCTKTPCDLVPGQDIVMHTVFKAPRHLTSMSTLAALYIDLGGISVPVPYNLGATAGTCDFLENNRCPIQEGEIVQYTLRMHIGVYMPLISAVRMEFFIVDEHAGPVVCVGIPVRGHFYTPPANQKLGDN